MVRVKYQDKKAVKEEKEPAVRRSRTDRTGLPDQLKSRMERLSGFNMDHVRVHYDSPRPAQMQALAYAQGADIHVAPGQERHLPHEAWHVVQQMQGRVRPTSMMGGNALNDDAALEHEADVMGAKAAGGGLTGPVQMKKGSITGACIQKRAKDLQCEATVQYAKKNGTTEQISKVGENDGATKTQVLDACDMYGLGNMRNMQGQNPAGQCAEPHALWECLKGIQLESFDRIQQIYVSSAVFTQACADRIAARIANGQPLEKEDLIFSEEVLSNRHIQRIKGEAAGDHDRLQLLVAQRINSKAFPRCTTCQQWIRDDDMVDLRAINTPVLKSRKKR